MAFVKLTEEGEATGRAAELFEHEMNGRGYVPNYLRLFALRTDVYDAWRKLIGSIAANMDLRRYELATLAAAQALRSSYCSLAHGMVLRNKFLSEDEMAAAAAGRADDPVDQGIIHFASKVAKDAAAIEQADIDSLHGLGLTDEEIFDVALAASARAFFSKTTDATGTEPDREYRELLGPELASSLAVGRSIES